MRNDAEACGWQLVLAGWSLLAAGWWLFAGWLNGRAPGPVAAAPGDPPRDLLPSAGEGPAATTAPAATAGEPAALPVRRTIFKPCPPLGAGVRTVPPPRIRALESFLNQLQPDDELLLGLPAEDRRAWEPWLRRWRRRAAGPPRWRAFFRPPPRDLANPKIAWQRALAPHARGEFWVWSDADIVAPAGFLAGLERERRQAGVGRGGAGLLTHAYVVRQTPHPAGTLDALFVNVEFYPGVRLLGAGGELGCAFGASLVFAAADFRAGVEWEDLGRCLADDFALAARLRPARLGGSVLETVPEVRSWGEAIGHYLRWQKTVRWCRPGPFAAQLVIFPLLGWVAAGLTHPGAGWPWLGAAGVVAAEACLGGWICARAGGPLVPARWPVLLLWSLLRSVGWVLCWAPWPVRWGERRWWGPRAAGPQPGPAAAPAIDLTTG